MNPKGDGWNCRGRWASQPNQADSKKSASGELQSQAQARHDWAFPAATTRANIYSVTQGERFQSEE